MHIDDEVLKKFQKGTLDSKELIEVLEHLETCSFCTDRWMNLEKEEMIQSPSYLKEDILKRVHKADVQVNIHIKKTSKKTELFFYSLKTTAAVLGALILLISISYVNTTERLTDYKDKASPSVSISEKLNEKSNEIVNIMTYFSNQIINGGKN